MSNSRTMQQGLGRPRARKLRGASEACGQRRSESQLPNEAHHLASIQRTGDLGKKKGLIYDICETFQRSQKVGQATNANQGEFSLSRSLSLSSSPRLKGRVKPPER